MKGCEICGGPIAMPSYRLSQVRLDARKFCSWDCKIASQGTSRQEAVVEKIPTETEAIEHASRAMLRSLVRYGLRHDGLPGLPAQRLLELARELEVA